MVVTRALIFVAFAALAAPALAQRTEIYKCLDASGRPSYTNDKRETTGRKCELVTTQINVAPPPPPPSAARQPARTSPSSFPKESPSERATAKGRQREILEKELAAEQQDLAKARQALAEQEAVRTGEERNYAKVLERLQPIKDRIETHEKNVEALKRELANLNR
jgi:Domain of unknown function (DUF4124)